MQRLQLGGSGIEVSGVCLGTMTFGSQTPEPEAHAQLNRALDAGITFLDTAEMYPVNPVRRETIGRTEEIVGRWLARGRRDRVQIATKITGPTATVRDGRPFDGAAITQCIEQSLRRLQTDHIHLYQLHWPVRGSYAFRQDWTYNPSGQDKARTLAHMDDVLAALDAARRAGKIGAPGVSNESAWGLARWLDQAGSDGPRMAAIQNEYSLFYRRFDTDLAETVVNEDVTLLAYSPLAAGLLTGKYQGGAIPAGSRAAVDKSNGGLGRLGGRKTLRALAAVGAYASLAAQHGWSLPHLAIAWTLTRPFGAVPVIGATTDRQLAELLAGLDRPLPADLRKAIDRLHKEHPQPY